MYTIMTCMDLILSNKRLIYLLMSCWSCFLKTVHVIKTENRRLRSTNVVHEIMHLHFILIFLGIKVSSDGSLTFSNAMTLYFPVPTSPMYYRELLVGNIQRNNTAGFSLYYLNATTWEIENGVDLDCSIEQSRGHADFFSIV